MEMWLLVFEFFHYLMNKCNTESQETQLKSSYLPKFLFHRKSGKQLTEIRAAFRAIRKEFRKSLWRFICRTALVPSIAWVCSKRNVTAPGFRLQWLACHKWERGFNARLRRLSWSETWYSWEKRGSTYATDTCIWTLVKVNPYFRKPNTPLTIYWCVIVIRIYQMYRCFNNIKVKHAKFSKKRHEPEYVPCTTLSVLSKYYSNLFRWTYCIQGYHFRASESNLHISGVLVFQFAVSNMSLSIFIKITFCLIKLSAYSKVL